MNALPNFEIRMAECLQHLSPTETQAHLPGKWTAQQIVQHLILTYAATTAVLAGRIAKGRPTQARPTLVQHCSRFYVVRLGFFPRGVRAPEAVVPPTTMIPESGEELAARAAAELRSLDKELERVSDLFGAETRSVSHRILGPLSPTQWRQFHTVHGLHHLGQIEAIKRARLLVS